MIGLLGFKLIGNSKKIGYFNDAWVQVLELCTWSTTLAKLIRSSTQGGGKTTLPCVACAESIKDCLCSG